MGLGRTTPRGGRRPGAASIGGALLLAASAVLLPEVAATAAVPSAGATLPSVARAAGPVALRAVAHATSTGCSAPPAASTTTTSTSSTTSTTLPSSTTTQPVTTTTSPGTTTSSSSTTTTGTAPLPGVGGSSTTSTTTTAGSATGGSTPLARGEQRSMALGPHQSGGSGTSGSPTTTSPSSGSATTTTFPVTAAATGYYLLESNGGIHPYGHAKFYGSKATDHHLGTTAVAGAANPNGGGYWLLTAKGNVFNFGTAVDYGTPVHSKHVGTFASIAATPDGQGFWVVTTRGNVFNYGDAAFCGSPVHRTLAGNVVSVVSTAYGGGYWVVTSGGNVFNFGDAQYFGSGHTASPVVGMAATPDGGGYWLAYANGSVRNFGDAKSFGSAVNLHTGSTVVSFTATPDGGGYWLAYANGSVRNFGDAKFFGSLVHAPPKAPLTITAIVETIEVPAITANPFTAGATGYDISDFQCSKTGSSTIKNDLPSSTGLAVLQAAGWLDSAANSCLAAEASWSTTAGQGGDPYDLYLFMNSPGTNSAAAAQAATGPAGTCSQVASAVQDSCEAYNYGYNGAANALGYASSQNVHAALWWLDVENDDLAGGDTSDFSAGQYWSDNTALNDEVIQGAIDGLRRGGAAVGIYSTSLQYPKIAGDFVPSGPQLPLWVAGVPWTNPPYSEGGLPGPSVLAAWCDGTASYAGSKVSGDVFAGGKPWLLQETPGTLPSPYGLDPDYAC